MCLAKILISHPWAYNSPIVIVFHTLAGMKCLLSCQPRVTVTYILFTIAKYKIETPLEHESIDHLCINPILWIGSIHK